MNRPRILFAILDWGIGHATRTTPLIEAAAASGAEVFVASRGTAAAWLRSALGGRPSITFLEKPGTPITYARRGTLLRIATQMPRFLTSISEEAAWAASTSRSLGITHIVSDNCYGVRVPGIPSVLITHQLHLPVPGPLKPAARAFVQRHARRFDEVWIPDLPGPHGGLLSGSLAAPLTSSPSTSSSTSIFIGPLSRLPHPSISSSTSTSASTSASTLGLVSGPEPHRTGMEEALRSWMLNRTDQGTCLIIAGKPEGGVRHDGPVTTWYDPTSEELAHALATASTVVCRSGYSTLLDLAVLGRTAVLVPTPGQPEQEDLARHWARAFGFATCSQTDLEAGRVPQPAGNPPHVRPNEFAIARLRAWTGISTLESAH